MNTYRKEVEGTDCSLVIARVFCKEDGARVGLEFFNIGTQKWMLKRAHKWADDRIKLLTEQETER